METQASKYNNRLPRQVRLNGNLRRHRGNTKVVRLMQEQPSIRRIRERINLKVWGWPVLICCLLIWAWILIFWLTSESKSETIVQPNSIRGLIMVDGLGIIFMSFLWCLAYRYRKIQGKSIGRLTKISLIFLSFMILLSIAAGIINYIVAFNN